MQSNLPKVTFEPRGKILRPNFDVIVTEYDDVALTRRKATVVAFAKRTGIVHADDLVLLIFKELAVLLGELIEFFGGVTANNNGKH